MFRLSRGVEYAIRGVLYLAKQPEGKVSFVEEVSSAQDVPRAYLAKIFQTLSKKGFVRSFRGPDGGFVISGSAKDLSILDVIEAIEGPIHLNECLIKVGFCDRDELCPVHDIWREAQDTLISRLTGTSFADLAEMGEDKASRRVAAAGG